MLVSTPEYIIHRVCIDPTLLCVLLPYSYLYVTVRGIMSALRMRIEYDVCIYTRVCMYV